MRLARRMQHGVLSPSVALANRVRRLRASGADIINFGTRPDVPTHVREAAIAFLHSGASSAYTDARGLPELRHAIAAKLARENALEVDADAEVVVTAGGKQAVYAALMALADRGDEVLVEDPGWVSFAPIVHLAGATPVPVPLREENRFVLDPGDLRERITPATRVLLLCNPHNPTGAVHDERSLEAIAEAAQAHNLVVVVDESYERLVYDGRRHVSMASLEGMRERTVTVQTTSKAYNVDRAQSTASPRKPAQQVRLDQEVLVSGGENISSLEVEECLFRHPKIMEAAVVARPDDHWGETVCAFVTRRDGDGDLTADDVMA